MCGLLFEMGLGVKDNKNPIYEIAKTNDGWGTSQGMTKKFWFMMKLLLKWYKVIY